MNRVVILALAFSKLCVCVCVCLYLYMYVPWLSTNIINITGADGPDFMNLPTIKNTNMEAVLQEKLVLCIVRFDILSGDKSFQKCVT
jgi:hypothetical protein